MSTTLLKRLFRAPAAVTGLLLMCSLWSSPAMPVLQAKDKPRVLILTDISSLKAGVMEPDDGQSLVRLMLYTNELQVEGFIASSNLGHGQRTQPELIHQVIDAYGKVQGNLLKHDRAYPSSGILHAMVKSGQPQAGPKIPVMTSIGRDRNTDGSEWIIRTVDLPDPRPVWLCVWGGTADLAQALWKVQQTRSPEQLQTFVAKLRIHAIADQDATGPWIRQQFPALFYILDRHNFRGIYRGGDTGLSDSAWASSHVKNGSNPLGMLYPNYTGGDIWTARLGRVKGIKEGDTASLLSLIANGLNIPEQPELGGWGGIYSRNSEGYYQDTIDSTAGYATDPTPYMASVYRWRRDWQADFEARLKWCTKTYRQANHHPQIVIDGDASNKPVRQTISAGSEIKFNAAKSFDPDKNTLRYHWAIYPQSLPPGVFLEGTETGILTCRIAKDVRVKTLPILLTVTDTWQPALSTYRRVLLEIRR